jgi:poly-gamma-glutamate capsule biosynthesis protein CapA/YwtB (metallophosphatase superfamily)
MIKITIGGDLAPTNSNVNLFCNANIKKLFGSKLLLHWLTSDIRIFNLETPITDKKTPIRKCGPNLIAPTSVINGIKALKPSLITLANNHILDQGIQGIISTRKILSDNNIPFIGIGNNIDDASRTYIIKKEGLKIGIYACSEHEFSIATENSPGANPFDPLNSFDHIRSLKNECDYVIVMYHGGKEQYRYPSPFLQKICRKMIEKGADSVICQHNHCIGCYEIYKDSNIIYGQGNFIFDHLDNEFWRTSLLIKLIITRRIKIEYIPIVKVENCIRLASDKEKEDILAAFNKRSIKILRKEFVKNNYKKFAIDNFPLYLRKFAGFGKILTILDRRFFNNRFLKNKYNKDQLLAIQNYIECEAHRELFLEGLRIINNRL